MSELQLLGEILGELKQIRGLLVLQAEDAGIEVVTEMCPHCHGTDFENTSAMGDANRSTCRGCGQSFTLEGH